MAALRVITGRVRSNGVRGFFNVEHVRLGKSGIQVSRLCFGSLTMGPLQRALTLKEGASLLGLAFELGVNFVDTAEIYGTYPYVRALLLSGVPRRRLVIVAKSFAPDGPGMRASLERALVELGTDYVDVFLLHEQESIHTLRGHAGALEALVRSKEKGLVRAVGLSTHHVAGVLAGASTPEIDIIHPLINQAGLGIRDGSADDMIRAIATAKEFDKGVYAMKVLGGGHLAREARRSVEFVARRTVCDAMALGMQDPEEVRLNALLVEWAYAQSGHEEAALSRLERDLAEERQGRPRRLFVIDADCVGCGSCASVCPQDALSMSTAGRTIAVDHARCILCGYCASACPTFALKVM